MLAFLSNASLHTIHIATSFNFLLLHLLFFLLPPLFALTLLSPLLGMVCIPLWLLFVFLQHFLHLFLLSSSRTINPSSCLLHAPPLSSSSSASFSSSRHPLFFFLFLFISPFFFLLLFAFICFLLLFTPSSSSPSSSPSLLPLIHPLFILQFLFLLLEHCDKQSVASRLKVNIQWHSQCVAS